jgi:hypothetical protein
MRKKMVRNNKNLARTSAARRAPKTKVEYKAERATNVDASSIHEIIVKIEAMRRRIRRKKWINGYPVRNPRERVGARYEAALKELRAVSKEMETVVRQEAKRYR